MPGKTKKRPVSEAQRRLMHAAANSEGGYRDVPQSVAKEFVAGDRKGKLPEHKKPAKSKGKRK
jgi:hypothetical protein